MLILKTDSITGQRLRTTISMQYTFAGKLHVILNGISIKIFRLSNQVAYRWEYSRLHHNLNIKAIKFVLKVYLM
jgi:hypothetical protein